MRAAIRRNFTKLAAMLVRSVEMGLVRIQPQPQAVIEGIEVKIRQEPWPSSSPARWPSPP
jgi:hypothetical protein